MICPVWIGTGLKDNNLIVDISSKASVMAVVAFLFSSSKPTRRQLAGSTCSTFQWLQTFAARLSPGLEATWQGRGFIICACWPIGVLAAPACFFGPVVDITSRINTSPKNAMYIDTFMHAYSYVDWDNMSKNVAGQSSAPRESWFNIWKHMESVSGDLVAQDSTSKLSLNVFDHLELICSDLTRGEAQGDLATRGWHLQWWIVMLIDVIGWNSIHIQYSKVPGHRDT